MEKLKEYGWIIGVIIAVILTGSVAYAAVSGIVIQNVESFNYSGDASGIEVALGSRGVSDYSNINVKSGGVYSIADTTVIDSSRNGIFANITGSGTLNALEGYTDLNLTATVTTTLTAAMSGETFYFGGVSSTAFVLPATSTSAGTVYRFVVDSAMTTTSTIQTASLANEIEGVLLVAGAVVDCDAEDTITIGASLENLGDFVELRSNGVKWFIGSSDTLTAGALTCSAT